MFKNITTDALKIVRRGIASIDSRVAGRLPPNIIDGTSTDFDIYKLLYPNRIPHLIWLPLQRGRGLDHFPLTENLHPFVHALNSANYSKKPELTITYELRCYYDRVTDLNAADWLGVGQHDHHLTSYPAWARRFPWEAHSPDQLLRLVRHWAHDDYARVKKNLSLDNDGWKTVGPVSNDLIQAEAERLLSLRSLILNNGYRIERPPMNPRGVLLLHDKERWCFVVGGGHHRAAVAAHLKLGKIPINIHHVIRRADVEHWPRVNQGFIDKDAALELFDRLILGKLPPAFHNWESYIAKHNDDLST